jgi:hypothetical protein
MPQPPQSTHGAAAPVELQPPSIEGVLASGKIESVVPSVQVLATELTSWMEMSTEVKPAAIEKQSQVENSAEKSSGETDAMENSAENSIGEIDAQAIKRENEKPSTKMENSAETEKSAAAEKSAGMEKRSELEKAALMEKIDRETDEFILRLDPTGTVSVMFLASPLYAVLAACPLWLVAD